MPQVAIPNFLQGFREHTGEALNNIIATNDSFLVGILKNANMNSTADQAITIQLPGAGAGGSGKYFLVSIIVANPSVSLTTAAGGVYTAAAKGGLAVVAAGQAYSALTTNVGNTAGGVLQLTLAAAATTGIMTATVLYFSLTTPQGAAATADIYVVAQVLP